MSKFDSIDKVRKQIDKIDVEILELIVKRQTLVVEAVKHKTREQIVDKKRIKKILISLKKIAQKKGLPPYIVENVWLEMINGFIKFEEEFFDQIQNKNN